MAWRIAVVIVATTTFSYFHIVSNLERQTLEQLSKYVNERGERESAIFELAEDNHRVLEAGILEELERAGDMDPADEFSQRFERQADGITRNMSSSFDGTKEAGVFIHSALRIDADVRRRVLAFQKLCNRYGPAWHNRFEDTYITTPENIMVIYWPEVPTWCQDATSELDMPSEEYVWVADKQHNPARETVWTGLFYDHVAEVWMVSCETPVDIGDRHVATLGHDILLNELLARTMDDRLDGTHNLIFRDDGRLIAHPELMSEIQDQGGEYNIFESDDELLKSIALAVDEMKPGETILANESNDAFLAVTRIEGPDWYFVTVLPNSVLTAQAISTVRILLLIGLLSLLVEVALLYWVLQSKVGSPLESFVDVTNRISSGEVSAKMDTRRDDELGRLALSFNSMVDAIAERDQKLVVHADELAARGDLLEAEVAERTMKLESATIDLLRAQKLESIGQLAAGVAHEINTPTQYVGDNTRFLEESFRELAPLLKKAAELAESVRQGTGSSELADELKAALEEADVEYLGEEIPRAIEQSLNGIDRVRKIVQSMKEFSHPGVEGMTSIDLNRAIESTITVASNEWKYVAELETDFDPELPPIACLPGEINQVVLNLIVNAAHAIADALGDGGEGKGTITISTRRDGEFVELRIGDTGSGIPEAAQGKIFDRFFTTKEAGKGTGQGLSIAHTVVVKKHGGTLDFETEIGKGTTFIIRLPLNQKTAAVEEPVS